MKCVIFLCLSLAFVLTSTGSASFITPCHYTDSKCIKKSAEEAMKYFMAGMPELDVPSFNPLHLNDVKGDNGDLKLFLKDIIVTSLTKCKINKIERPDKLKLVIELITPITVSGHYTAGGKLYVLPIAGDGAFEIETEATKIFVSVNLKEIEKNGKKYYKFANFDFNYDVQKKVHFKFENLFGGDEEKAKPVHAILDESWKEVIDIIGGPVIKELMTRSVHHIGKFFINTPCNELELE